MFIADTQEQLLKEVVKREVREDLGCELEDLLNPIKVCLPPLGVASNFSSRYTRHTIITKTRNEMFPRNRHETYMECLGFRVSRLSTTPDGRK
jgi:hypothetical protein